MTAMTERQSIALRVPKDQLAKIDGRARKSDMTRTEFMIRASLGDLTNPNDADARLADVEKRLANLEGRVDYLT